MSNASDLLAKINAGATLYIRNSLHTWKIDAKAVARFAKAGHVILKDGSKPGHLLMASGKKFVRIDLCHLVLA